MAHIPGIKVVIPANPYDAKGLLISALRDPDPVIFLEPKRIYRAVREEVPSEEYTVPLSSAKVVQVGKMVTVVAWGAMVREVVRAAELMEAEGISVEIIDLRTVSPMDDETVVESIKKTGRGVIVHEACRTCGLAAELIARIQEKAFLSLAAPLERVTGFDTVVPLLKLEDNYLPDAFRISRAIKKVINY